MSTHSYIDMTICMYECRVYIRGMMSTHSYIDMTICMYECGVYIRDMMSTHSCIDMTICMYECGVYKRGMMSTHSYIDMTICMYECGDYIRGMMSTHSYIKDVLWCRLIQKWTRRYDVESFMYKWGATMSTHPDINIHHMRHGVMYCAMMSTHSYLWRMAFACSFHCNQSWYMSQSIAGSHWS